MPVSVFVSYSHDDAVLVTPVVKLLRLNEALVFQDLDSIELGKKWREQIGRALAEAHLVVVFWCVHSSVSSEVESEYKSALQTGKDLLPVLLDATPLPADLSEFQWIDFRGTVGANHAAARVPPVAPVSTRPKTLANRSIRFSFSAAMAIVLVIVAVSFWSIRGPKDVAPPVIPTPEVLPAPSPIPNVPLPHSELYLFFAILVLLLIAAGIFLWRRRRGRVMDRYSRTLTTASEEPHRRMATEIEAEILRRSASFGTDGV
jgi:TIR domain